MSRAGGPAARPDGPTGPPCGDAALARQARLVEALRDPARHDGTVVNVGLIETHISWVLLTGRHAYKIRKAVRLGFLDFSTLEARRFDCEEELRLNRRLAPDLYLDVVAITGTDRHPAIGGSGPVLEYAVRMREFRQEGLLDAALLRGELTPAHVDRLAALVANFHRRIAVAGADSPFGTPEAVQALALANFAEIRPLVGDAGDIAALHALRRWTRAEGARCDEAFRARRAAGFVRECHGDLHLANIALVGGDIVIFDAIEFNERMRWIDVASEIAFTIMDLEHRGAPALARRFLNAYLEGTGDYAAVGVLRFYLVYRAMVRAKVACLRTAEVASAAEAAPLLRDFRAHLRLAEAEAAADTQRPTVVITHGVAGSGKSTVAQALLEHGGAIRIRSDVERKRLRGMDAMARSGSGVAGDLYADDATRATYARVALLARTVVAAGRTVIVDAACLRRWQRDLFRDLAQEAGVPRVILDVSAPAATLGDRVRARAARADDASEADVAVLLHQQRTAEALAADECADAVPCDGGTPLTPETIAALWDRVAGRRAEPVR